MDLVLARNTAGKSGNQPPVRHAIEHRQLFGQPQRLVQRQEIAVNQQLEVLGPLRRRGRQQVRRIHQPIGRAVVLVEPDAVIAEPVELLPGLEVLGVGAHRHLRPEESLRQRPWQLALAILEVLQVLAVRHQIKDKDSHARVLFSIPIPITCSNLTLLLHA